MWGQPHHVHCIPSSGAGTCPCPSQLWLYLAKVSKSKDPCLFVLSSMLIEASDECSLMHLQDGLPVHPENEALLDRASAQIQNSMPVRVDPTHQLMHNTKRLYLPDERKFKAASALRAASDWYAILDVD